MKSTKLYSKMLLVKTSEKQLRFLTFISSDYVVLQSFKEFWKNGHFENMQADLLRRCQNSLRQTYNAFAGMTILSLLSRTTDAQRGNSLYCTAENSLPLPNF